MSSQDDWITSAEAVEISGYGPNYIRDLIYARKIIARKWARSWQISRSSLLEYLDAVKKLGGKRGPKPTAHT